MRSTICVIFALYALFNCLPAIDAQSDAGNRSQCCCAVSGFNEVVATLYDWSCVDHIEFNFPLTVTWNDGTSSTISLDWVIDINNEQFTAIGSSNLVPITGTAFAGSYAKFSLNLIDNDYGCYNGDGISKVTGDASLFIRSVSGGVYGADGWRSCTGSAVITFNPAIPLVDDPTLALVDHTIIIFDECVGTCVQ